MTTVQITGSQKTFFSISLVKVLMREMRVGLAEAKGHVDGLLTGKPIRLRFPDPKAARRFLDEANALGAIGIIEEG